MTTLNELGIVPETILPAANSAFNHSAVPMVHMCKPQETLYVSLVLLVMHITASGGKLATNLLIMRSDHVCRHSSTPYSTEQINHPKCDSEDLLVGYYQSGNFSSGPIGRKTHSIQNQG